jgi:hypothetical protein
MASILFVDLLKAFVMLSMMRNSITSMIFITRQAAMFSRGALQT